jgi:hypothetical protein
MKLYHGTISTGAENIIKNGIKLERGKPKVDFGQGFYTTPSFNFAMSTAINKANKTNAYDSELNVKPCILTYNFDLEKAKKNCNVLTFSETDIKWAQFIINNRNGFDYMDSVGSHFHNVKHQYDIVQGSIADNEIVLLAKNLNTLKERVKTNDIDSMLYSYITKQISFHTYKSLNYIQLTGCDIIKEKKGDVVNE